MIKKLVLFDIDGTILVTRGAGRRAITKALEQELGVAGSFDGIRFDGKTDPQIVREILLAVGHPTDDLEDGIEATCARYVELLEVELAGERHHIDLFEGVEPLLDALDEREDALVGLLTGNIQRGAHLKLRCAGIETDRFAVGAFGSDAEIRAHLPPVAAARAEPHFGRRPAGEEIVIIGDTPADMTCGESLGARAIGVTTGHYDTAALREAGAFAVFETLADLPAVMDSIFGT